MIRSLYLFLTFLFFCSTVVNAQKMKIVRCTTSNIVIGGVKCVVGDTFDKKYKIVLEARSKIFASFLCDDLDKNIITNILDVAICHNLSRVI